MTVVNALSAVVLIASLCASATYLRWLTRRDTRDLQDALQPPLAAVGLTYLSSHDPGPFRRGPFPKLQAGAVKSVANPWANDTTFETYRLVTATDEHGVRHELWAKLDFDADLARAQRVQWRSRRPESLSERARYLLKQ